jgi:hypothetical protein
LSKTSRSCWTYRTPHGDFQIIENGDERFEPSFKGVNKLGSFHYDFQALEDLRRDFPGLPDDLEKWEHTSVEF